MVTRWSKQGTSGIFTIRNEVAKVMFLQASVCPQGGCLPQCVLGYPPRADSPRPGSRHPHGADTPPPRETATAADGTHPTGMHSCSPIKIITWWSFRFILGVVFLRVWRKRWRFKTSDYCKWWGHHVGKLIIVCFLRAHHAGNGTLMENQEDAITNFYGELRLLTLGQLPDLPLLNSIYKKPQQSII